MRIPHDTHAAPLLGLSLDRWGSAYYRLAVPLGVVGGAVAPLYGGATESQRDAAEAVVVSRLSARPGADLDALRRLIEGVLKGGGRRRLIADLDDDYRRTPDPTRRAASNYPALDLVARLADTVVVTGEVLAGRLRGVARDVRVLPNLVRPDEWPAPAPPADGPVVIVLAGSSSHADDWRVVAPALRRLRARHGAGVRVRAVGYAPAYLEADEIVPWGPVETYPAALAGAHIGLCPLPRTPFNEAKSPVKAYEYALAGLAVVASPCQYGPLLRQAGLGDHVVPDAGNWLPALDSLVVDAPARRAAADALRAYVARHLDARRHADAIRAAYAA